MNRLGEVQCLLPCHTKIMVLTATATKSVQSAVACTLGMDKPIVIALSPCKVNLVYNMGRYTSMCETFMPLLNRLKKEKTIQ